MKVIYNNFFKIFEPWFQVDSRSLGIFRIFLGFLCLVDISRRWEFIDVFYTNNSIISASSSNSYYKMFTLLTSFTKSWEVHLFLFIGIIASICLILGYRTKLAHLVSAIVIISLHNRAIILENAADMFFNSILIWTLFLPLGITYSIDALKKSLSDFKDDSIEHLNDRELGINKPSKVYSLAYFAVLYQIAAIYFFTALNKSGYDWTNGSAVYKMFQLDTFLTPIGFFIRDYITPSVSKLLTYSTIYLEYSITILLFIPFYSYIFRFIAVVALTIFHASIRMSVKVGLFSQTMMITYILLIDSKIYDFINHQIKKYFNKKNRNYILFYDSDCGFCHYTVRIIKRLDIYNRITFADETYEGEKPPDYDKLNLETAILYEKESKKSWIKHRAFGKVLNLIPFGFVVGWIFFIPVISNIFEKVYDFVAKNRTYISNMFGQPACGMGKQDKTHISIDENINTPLAKGFVLSKKIVSTLAVLILIIATLNYNLVANESVNKYMSDKGYKKFQYKKNLKRIAYYPRMIQRWNMFSPTVLKTDKTVVVEATLYNGEIIDLFTGKPPMFDNLDYDNLWHGHNQFWRKFFSRISKKNNKKYIETFERWIKRNSKTYFADVLNGERVKSVKIWSISQKNADMNSTKTYKVYKQLLNKPKNQNNKSKPKK